MSRTDDHLFIAAVHATSSPTPGLRRLVLGGEGLTGFSSTGAADEWLRLVVPTPDGPQSRWYTVRRWDPAAGELTVDVVVHEHGLVTAWAAAAQVGDEVAVSAPAGRYDPPADTDWILVIADQTGLPAASRILEELPSGSTAYAILEAPGEQAVLAIESPAEVDVRWVFNPSPEHIPSPLGVAARSFRLPPGIGYVWMAGEAACSREVRRYFRHELGWPSRCYDIVGYWRPDAEAYLRRYAVIEKQVAEIWNRGEAERIDQEVLADRVYAVMEAHGL